MRYLPKRIWPAASAFRPIGAEPTIAATIGPEPTRCRCSVPSVRHLARSLALVTGLLALSCGGGEDPPTETPVAPEPVRTDTTSAQAPPAAASPAPSESPVWVPP